MSQTLEANRRNSKRDLENVQALHDRAVSLGAKCHPPTLEAARRNSKADKARIQKVHDIARQLGASCDSGNLMGVLDAMKNRGIEADGDEDNLFIEFRLNQEDADKLAIEGGEPSSKLHITLVYIPDPKGHRDAARRAVARFASTHAPLSGETNGGGRFSRNEGVNRVATWAYFDSPELPALRQDLVNELVKQGVPYAPIYGFVPHITLAYTEPYSAPPLNTARIPMTFDSIRFHWGKDVEVFPLSGKRRLVSQKKTEGALHRMKARSDF